MLAYSRRFSASRGSSSSLASISRKADDRVERRAKLVTDIGEEARFAGHREFALAAGRRDLFVGAVRRRHIPQDAEHGRFDLLGASDVGSM